MLAGCCINWKSKQQSVVAQSSKEAEFVALASCVREVLWLCKFAFTLGKDLEKSVVDKILDIYISEDNQACISETENPVLSDLSKHIYLIY